MLVGAEHRQAKDARSVSFQGTTQFIAPINSIGSLPKRSRPRADLQHNIAMLQLQPKLRSFAASAKTSTILDLQWAEKIGPKSAIQ